VSPPYDPSAPDALRNIGVKVPQKVKLSDGNVDKSVIQFNVKYNEDIFTNPPPKADPEA